MFAKNKIRNKTDKVVATNTLIKTIKALHHWEKKNSLFTKLLYKQYFFCLCTFLDTICHISSDSAQITRYMNTINKNKLNPIFFSVAPSVYHERLYCVLCSFIIIFALKKEENLTRAFRKSRHSNFSFHDSSIRLVISKPGGHVIDILYS